MSAHSDPVRASPHIHALLDRLHGLSVAEESETVNNQIAGLKELRTRDPEAGNAALQALMVDKFVALDRDKCQLVYQLARATGARTAVEVGTSFGVSTIYLALAVGENDPQGGRLLGRSLKAQRRQEQENTGRRLASVSANTSSSGRAISARP